MEIWIQSSHDPFVGFPLFSSQSTNSYLFPALEDLSPGSFYHPQFSISYPLLHFTITPDYGGTFSPWDIQIIKYIKTTLLNFLSLLCIWGIHMWKSGATFRSQFFPCGSRVLNSSYQTHAQCCYPLDNLTSPGALFLQFFIYGDSSCPSRTPLCHQFFPKDLLLLCHPICYQPFLRHTKISQHDLL